jgi:PilZ domain
VDRKVAARHGTPHTLAVPESIEPELRERQHPRVTANLAVQVRGPGMVRQAVAEDLSLAGLRVLGLRAPIGQALTVLLPLPDDRVLTLRGSVVRQDSTGVALEYDGLDWDDLFALARYLHPRLP